MNQKSNPNLTAYAKKLRKNMTKEERLLWYRFLKNLPVTVNRQKVIGAVIVDFYCAKAKLVIELDGSQHFEEDHPQEDRRRDAYLSDFGLTVLRYTNLEINQNFEGVCSDILRKIAERSEP